MSENRNGLLAEDAGAGERESRDDLLAAGLRAAADLIGETYDDDPTEWDFETLTDGTVFGAPRSPACTHCAKGADDPAAFAACESVQMGTDGLHVSPRLAERLEGYATRQVVHVLETLPGLSWLIVEGGKVIAGGRASPDVVPAPDGLAVSRQLLDLIEGVPRHEPAEGEPVLIRPANATGWKLFGELASALGAMRLSGDVVELQAEGHTITARVSRNVKAGLRSSFRVYACEEAQAYHDPEGVAHVIACEMFLELGGER